MVSSLLCQPCLQCWNVHTLRKYFHTQIQIGQPQSWISITVARLPVMLSHDRIKASAGVLCVAHTSDQVDHVASRVSEQVPVWPAITAALPATAYGASSRIPLRVLGTTLWSMSCHTSSNSAASQPC